MLVSVFIINTVNCVVSAFKIVFRLLVFKNTNNLKTVLSTLSEHV